MLDISRIADALHVDDVALNPERDVLKRFPDLTVSEAYDVQFELMQKRVAQGDAIKGYQASFTSRAMQQRSPGFPAPYYGTLLASNLRFEPEPIELNGRTYGVEAEIGIILKRDLQGPDLTPADVLGSIEAVVATVECAVARPRDDNGKLLSSAQHLIATHNTDSHILVGTKFCAPTFDLRLEGVTVSVNGCTHGSATGVEAMGNPANVVCAMANFFAGYEKQLSAGELIMTGALVTPPRVSQANTVVDIEFATLGRIGAIFVEPN